MQAARIAVGTTNARFAATKALKDFSVKFQPSVDLRFARELADGQYSALAEIRLSSDRERQHDAPRHRARPRRRLRAILLDAPSHTRRLGRNIFQEVWRGGLDPRQRPETQGNRDCGLSPTAGPVSPRGLSQLRQQERLSECAAARPLLERTRQPRPRVQPGSGYSPRCARFGGPCG